MALPARYFPMLCLCNREIQKILATPALPWTVATPRMPWTEARSPCVVDAPDELCCPITLELMRDPVQTILGQTFEREAIEDWLKTHKTDPVTGEKLPASIVFASAKV